MGGALLGLANVEPVVECLQCDNKLALKKKQSGGWMVSCQGGKFISSRDYELRWGARGPYITLIPP